MKLLFFVKVSKVLQIFILSHLHKSIHLCVNILKIGYLLLMSLNYMILVLYYLFIYYDKLSTCQ